MLLTAFTVLLALTIVESAPQSPDIVSPEADTVLLPGPLPVLEENGTESLTFDNTDILSKLGHSSQMYTQLYISYCS